MILSKTEIDAMQPENHYPSQYAVKDLLDTIAAKDAALEAWVEYSRYEMASDYDKAAELTKAAGCWPEGGEKEE